MCGIVGYLGRERPQPEGLAWIERARDRLAHRGPDSWGSWCAQDGSVALGHRRLSILDLSDNGHQPMLSVGGRYRLVFNGEIYNFRDLRQELEARGCGFRGGSDTEVVLAAFNEWGISSSLARFNGMYAIGVWDSLTRELTLARDFYGKKPLYYGWDGDGWVFASELKALNSPGLEIDQGALAAYFRFGYVPSPYSIYKGFRKLEPASWVCLRSDQRHPAVKKFSLPCRDNFGCLDQPAEVAEKVLARAVSRRMVADVPLGAFLSGGIDSSLIVCLMQRQSTRPIKTFCLGFAESSHDESHYAANVARHLGTEHVEHRLTADEALAVVPLLPDIYDEPFADSSQIPTYLVSRLARPQVTVALTGDGGDEVFGGYNRYLFAPALWRILKLIPLRLRRLLFLAARHLPARQSSFLLGRVSYPEDKWAKLLGLFSVESPQQLYARLVCQWEHPPLLVAGGEQTAVDRFEWGTDFVEDMMRLDSLTYLPDDILVKVDRASMAVSLECRAPFLDPEVAAFAGQLQLKDKISGGIGKLVIRQILRKFLPPELLKRPKAGFSIPLSDWLRGPLRAWAEDLLDSGRLSRQGILDGQQVRKVWLEHLSGRRNWSAQLWCVLMFQAWHQRWIGADDDVA